MLEPAAPAAPTFAIGSLVLEETRLLQLVLADVLPSPASPLAHTVASKAEVLFSSQPDDSLRVEVHTTITGTAKVRRGTPKPRVQVQVAVLFRYAGLDELRRGGALPLPLAWTAVSLAYSTVRGMLQVKLAGTSFAHVVLPIVPPQQLWQPAPPTAEAAAG